MDKMITVTTTRNGSLEWPAEDYHACIDELGGLDIIDATNRTVDGFLPSGWVTFVTSDGISVDNPYFAS